MPLIHVIRDKEANNVAPPREDSIQELVHLAPLGGSIYMEDKQRIYCIIRDAVLGTKGWTWMQDIKNKHSRLAIKNLCNHYEGPGARTHGVQDAKETLKACHYKSKTTFHFQSYVSILKDCFAMLADDECPVTKCDKLDYLLDGIQNVSLVSTISNISMMAMLWSSFKEATNILMREVQQLFPLATNKGKQMIM